MPRKDNIRKDYHSKNPRAKSDWQQRAGVNNGDDAFFDNSYWGWSSKNLDSLINVMSKGTLRNERDYWIYSVANAIPGLSGYLQGVGQYEDLKSYMKEYGLTWKDIKPWRITNMGAVNFYRQTTNFIGDMVKELYT